MVLCLVRLEHVAFDIQSTRLQGRLHMLTVWTVLLFEFLFQCLVGTYMYFYSIFPGGIGGLSTKEIKTGAQTPNNAL